MENLPLECNAVFLLFNVKLKTYSSLDVLYFRIVTKIGRTHSYGYGSAAFFPFTSIQGRCQMGCLHEKGNHLNQ